MDKLFAVGLLIIGSAGSVAAEGFYAGAAFSSIQAEEEGADFETTNLTGIVGYEINQNFAVEGELSFSVAEDEVNVDGTIVDIGLSYAGAFVKASLPLSPEFSAHGRLGYVNAEAEASVGDVSATSDDSTVAFGIGAEYAVGSNIAIRADATFAEFEETETTVLSFGTVFRF